MKESNRSEVKMNKRISFNLSQRCFSILVISMLASSAFAQESFEMFSAAPEKNSDQRIKIQGAASFYFENHSLPTSKREQTDLDLNEFHFATDFIIQPEISLHIHPEITRNSRDNAGTKNNDQQVRFRAANLNRHFAESGLSFSVGLLEPNINEKYFDQYASLRWMHPNLRPIEERYRLFPDSDLGMRLIYRQEGLSVDASYTNGEGQGPETGSRKSTQLRVSWNQYRFLQLWGFYLTGGDETYAPEIAKTEVFQLGLISEVGLLTLNGSYTSSLHPADRLTTSKAWSGIDLLAYANQSVRGNAVDLGVSVELGRLLPFIKWTQGTPVEGNKDYSFQQGFYGIAYDLGPYENLGFYTYRLRLNEKHSLQSKDQDGFGISYGLFLN